MKSNEAPLLRSALIAIKVDARKRRRSMLNDHLAFAAFCNHVVCVCDLVSPNLRSASSGSVDSALRICLFQSRILSRVARVPVPMTMFLPS